MVYTGAFKEAVDIFLTACLFNLHKYLYAQSAITKKFSGKVNQKLCQSQFCAFLVSQNLSIKCNIVDFLEIESWTNFTLNFFHMDKIYM